MKICFFGVGGVGGYFGTLVTKAFGDKHKIYFVARGRHKEVINEEGLTLKRAGGKEVIKVFPTLCTDTVDDLGICDIIVLSVKGYDLKNATEEIAKITNDNTVILPLLNGVDIYERIRKYLTEGIVLPSCVYVGTHIESPGVIYQRGGSCTISMGSDPQHIEYYPESLLHVLRDAGVDVNWEKNIEVQIWSKYMFIAAYGLVSAAYNKTMGEILENESLRQIVKSIMLEIAAIAENLNIRLRDDIVEISLLKAQQFPYETKTSFQRDVESKGRINEGDLFGGTLIRYAKKLGVDVPTATRIYGVLQRKLDNVPM